MEKWIMANYRIQGMPSSTFNFHSHHEYEIYFFHEGECRYLINNRIYDLQPGDIFLMDGLTLHKPNPRIGSTYIRSHIHFSPTWLKEILSILGIQNVLDPFQKLKNSLLRTGFDEFGQFVDGKMQRITSLMMENEKQLQQSKEKSEIVKAEVNIELVQLLLGIYKMSQKDLAHVTSKNTEKELHAQAIASWIDAHYKEKVSLDRMSQELNLSKYYASHVFKEITGFTVMEYVMGCRVNQVKYLLEMEPDQSLAEVSRATGFESISHFSRYFKEKVGVTPSHYRKSKLSLNQ